MLRRVRPFLGALVPIVCGVSVSFVANGCSSAKVLLPSPGDALREENRKLRERGDQLALQVKELETRIAERQAATNALKAGAPAAASVAEVDAATPRIATVQIEGATEIVLATPDASGPALLRLWIMPRDGRGRFLQIVGTLKVGVAVVRADAAPIPIAQVSIGPVAVRDGWRSGFMGTHYAFEVPITIPRDLVSTAMTISIRFDDALSGRSFEDERRIAAPRALTATLSTEAP